MDLRLAVLAGTYQGLEARPTSPVMGTRGVGSLTALTVSRLTRNARAATLTDPPLPGSPGRLPASRSPAPVACPRSRMVSRSHSARESSMWSMRREVGLSSPVSSPSTSITTSVQGGMWGDARMAARRLAWERLARSLLSCVSSSHRSNSVGPNRSRGSISRTTR